MKINHVIVLKEMREMKRVWPSPRTIAPLIQKIDVMIESGAGALAGFSEDESSSIE